MGITLTSIYSTEKDLRLEPGQSYELGGYSFTFNGVEMTDGANYRASRGDIDVTRDGRDIAKMQPEKRIYLVQRMPMTEAAIDAGLTRDLFVAMGEPLGSEGAWSVRIYHKPYVRWIWLGALIMSLGGILAASDRRYRLLARRRKSNVKVAAEATA